MKTKSIIAGLLAVALPTLAGNFTINSQADSALYRDKAVKIHEIVPDGGYLVTKAEPLNVVFTALHLNAQTECSTFTSESVARVLPNSRLKIEKVDVNYTGIDRISTIKLTLLQGDVLFAIPRMSAPSQFQIKTPFGEISSGVGRFEVTTNGVRVVAGSIQLLVPENKPVIVSAGQDWNGELKKYTQSTDSPNWDNIQVLFPEIITYTSDYTKIYISPVRS